MISAIMEIHERLSLFFFGQRICHITVQNTEDSATRIFAYSETWRMGFSTTTTEITVHTGGSNRKNTLNYEDT